MSKKPTLDEIDKSLAADLDFKELARLLHDQTPEQRARFEDWLSELEELSQTGGNDDAE